MPERKEKPVRLSLRKMVERNWQAHLADVQALDKRVSELERLAEDVKFERIAEKVKP